VDSPTQERRCFGIIPAAGKSVRMGTHKLLLAWEDATVMDHVLSVWTASRVKRVVVIVRQHDSALREICQRWSDIDLVVAQNDPEDMKASIQLGLTHIAKHHQPHECDRWLVAPADLPTLNTSLIDQLVGASQETDSIVVPRYGDRRGHPISFPWSLATQAFELGDIEGIDVLIKSHPGRFLHLPAADRPGDIDTPDEYSRLQAKRHG